MTVSNSVDFIVSTKDIIQEAYELLGVVAEGQSPTTAQTKSALRTLNMMTKTWQADGLNLFAVEEVFLFLRQNQRRYTLTSTSTDNFTSQFDETITTAASVLGATTITVADVSTIAENDFIGVKTDQGEVLHWTTVSGAPAGNVVTLADALPAAVSSGVTVYSYTTKANRPMKVLEGYTVRFSNAGNGVDVPVGIIGRVDYGELANKDASGVVNQIYQDPQVGSFGLNVWPVTDSERDYLRLFVQRTLSDFDCLPNTPDYPQEWYLPLAYNLAAMLGPKFGTPARTYNIIRQNAAALYITAQDFDEENESSLFFRPDTWGRDVARSGA